MITVKEEAALVGVAELRSKAAKILKEIKKYKIILTKRNKPIGVIIDYDEYERIQSALEEVENFVLGKLAEERRKRKDKKVLTLEEAERKVGLG